MAAPGVPVNLTALVTETPSEAWPLILSATAGFPDYSVTSSTDAQIVLNRHYVPTGALLTGSLSIMALATTDNTVVINMSAQSGGTLVEIEGIASQDMANKLDELLYSGVWLHVASH